MTLIPIQVTFRGLPPSEAMEADVRERVTSLEQFYAGIVRCRVLVEIPHRHQHDGRHFHVRIEVTVPGRDPIVVSHEPSLHARLKDVEGEVHHKETDIERVHRYAPAAIRDAFDVARRRLEDVAREQRGTVKAHEVAALDDAFDDLDVGTPVAFVEEQGEKGAQASTVRLLGTHHYASR